MVRRVPRTISVRIRAPSKRSNLMRKAFTLIELLVIIGIMGAMVTVSVMNVRAGQGAARVKGATRDIFAAIRHARSTALVTGQRVLVTYSNEKIDDEPAAKIDVVAAKIMSAEFGREVAQPYYALEYKDLPDMEATGRNMAGSTNETTEVGETIEEILFSPMDASVVKGIRIKVVKGDDAAIDESEAQTRSRISVFSNVDYLIGKYKDAKSKSDAEESESGRSGNESSPSESRDKSGSDDMPEPVNVVWETNGSVEPHSVWVYPDGKRPEDGLMLRIDRFGAVKVLNGDGKEDD